MSIRIADTISVPTLTGDYQIQLCYGDITKLQEKMDIIMVSAFPGDYAAVPSTLIGALKRNLNVSVQQLARYKEMDLRVQCSCWMSQPLEEHLPYKRLLCFERSRAKGDVIEQIRDMFRVFVPACSNQETSVITPLLGTGNQGFSESVVLSCMVETAANWMQAGLPLKLFRLVVYDDDDSNLNKLFSELKKKIQKATQKKGGNVEVVYDVFITYEEKDKEWVSMISKVLQKKNKELKVYSELQAFDKKKAWQDSIFHKMACSKRIIALLTPSFVQSKNCLDQFNMAMCCNRLHNSELLFPFLITTVDSMPVYMRLVQYFDCRIRKEGDVLEVKIDQACTVLMNPPASRPTNNTDVGPEERFDYDIFISYSHRQPKQAEKLLSILSSANSDLKIFFDRSELTMGSIWQSSLYQCLDGSEIIIALVSPDYFSSVVCQEEYNIALARHLAWPSEVLFIPVLVEPMTTVPSHFGRVCMIDGIGDKFEKVVENLAERIIGWRTSSAGIPYLQHPVDSFSFECVENKREKMAKKEYILDTKLKNLNPANKIGTLRPSPKGEIDVAVSFARDTTAYAGTINKVMEANNPELKISFLNENTSEKMKDLDSAKQILVILSKDYIQSAHHMEELHVALCRQRDTKSHKIVKIIIDEDIPEKPMFLHLLPCDTNLSDKFWTQFEKMSGVLESKTVMSYRAGMRGSFLIPLRIYYGLQKTAFDVMRSLSGSKNEDEQIPPIICNVLEAKLIANQYPASIAVSECLIDIFSDNKKIQIQPLKEIKAGPEIPVNIKSDSTQTNDTTSSDIDEMKGTKIQLKERGPRVKFVDDKNAEIKPNTESKAKHVSHEGVTASSMNTNNKTVGVCEKKESGDATSGEGEKKETRKNETAITWADEDNNTKHIQRALKDFEIQKELEKMMEEDENRKNKKSSSCNVL